MPKWGEVIKSPVRYLLDARDYHDATCNCLFEVRLASSRATIDAARAAAIENNVGLGLSAEEDNVPGDSTSLEPNDAAMQDAPHDATSPGPQVDMQIEDASTARVDNVMVDAGADVSVVTLHFGVGDVPVTITPRQRLIDISVLYIGPLVLSGYAMLIPCDDNDLDGRSDSIVIGHYQQAYFLEFYGMSWRSPADHPMRVSTFPDDDSLSLASLKATYGGDRETIHMFYEDRRLDMLDMNPRGVSSG